MRLTSSRVTFALHVHVAPLPVLFEGAALLVAATAVVALIGLFYCKQEFQLFTNEPDDNISLVHFQKWFHEYRRMCRLNT